mmetsp:Transcript_13569/g.31700  ORF Transcript_13569/g.31700 Transcript_13569/m.31700 type:complete len:230 (+) Transcript_13569:186-875(+)
MEPGDERGKDGPKGRSGRPVLHQGLFGRHVRLLQGQPQGSLQGSRLGLYRGHYAGSRIDCLFLCGRSPPAQWIAGHVVDGLCHRDFGGQAGHDFGCGGGSGGGRHQAHRLGRCPGLSDGGGTLERSLHDHVCLRALPDWICGLSVGETRAVDSRDGHDWIHERTCHYHFHGPTPGLSILHERTPLYRVHGRRAAVAELWGTAPRALAGLGARGHVHGHYALFPKDSQDW